MTKYAQQILDLVLCSTEHPTARADFFANEAGKFQNRASYGV